MLHTGKRNWNVFASLNALLRVFRESCKKKKNPSWQSIQLSPVIHMCYVLNFLPKEVAPSIVISYFSYCLLSALDLQLMS